MACRDLSRGEKAKDDIRQKLQNVPNLGNIVVKRLDLSSLKSVRTFADEILKEEPKIQILINNAGMFFFLCIIFVRFIHIIYFQVL